MKRIEVIGHLDRKDDVLRLLQQLGVVEIEDITQILEQRQQGGDDAFADLRELLNRDGDPDRLAAVEGRISEVRSTIDFIERFYPRKKAFIEQFAGSQIPVSHQELDAILSDAGAVDRIVALSGQLEREYLALTNRESDLLQIIGQMEPWEQLDVPVELLASTRRTAVFAGVVESKGTEEISAALAEASDGCVVVDQISRDDHSTRLIVAVHREYEESVSSVLRAHGYSSQSFPFEQGRVIDFLSKAKEELRRVRTSISDVILSVKKLADERTRLLAVLDAYEVERDRMQVTERLARTQNTFGLLGWAKDSDSEGVEKALVQLDDALIVSVSDPDPADEPPVALVNNRLVRPFEVVLDLYSLPQPHEIDPTALVGFFFALLFALASADIGYGIALAVICLLLLRKVRMSDLGRKTFELVFIAGVATAVIGVATGSVFGASLGFSLLSPVDEPIVFLLLSFAVGIIHIYAGMIVKLYEEARSGNLIGGILDQGLWLLLLTSSVVLVAQFLGSSPVPGVQYAKYGAIIGAAGIVLTHGRHQKNPLMKLGSGLASLYGISGYLGDVLSYIRLLGLGMASGVIASVINLVAGIFWSLPVIGPVITIAILLGGHVFNLFIGVIGAFVHVSRLQYVEFFGKFFEGGGRVFAPFKAISRYVYVDDVKQQ